MGLDRARGKAACNQGWSLTLSNNPPICTSPQGNTNRPWVMSLFTIPTVLSVIMVMADWSVIKGAQTPLWLHFPKNKQSPAVGALRCFAWRSLNVFDKGKRLGIYFLQLPARLQFPQRPTGVSVDPGQPAAPSKGIWGSILDVFIWGNFICFFFLFFFLCFGKYSISLHWSSRIGDNANTINQWRGWNDGIVREARLTARWRMS